MPCFNHLDFFGFLPFTTIVVYLPQIPKPSKKAKNQKKRQKCHIGTKMNYFQQKKKFGPRN